jgi:hypothetical protein
MVLMEVVNDDVRNVVASNDEFHICGGGMQDTGLKGGSQEAEVRLLVRGILNSAA